MSTPTEQQGVEFIDAFNEQFKQPEEDGPVFRAIHARGLSCQGVFRPNGAAAAFTVAPHLTDKPSRVLARFSNGSGDPKEHDAEAFSRGFAVRFLPSGVPAFDLLSIVSQIFVTNDPDQFLSFVKASGGRFAAVEYAAFSVNSANKAMMARVNAQLEADVPVSAATTRWHAVHPFKVTNAAGDVGHVRFGWVPVLPEERIARDAAKARFGPNYLMEDMRRRLDAGSVEFDLEVVLRGAGDPLDDLTQIWPYHRERVVVGRLTLEAVDPHGDSISFRVDHNATGCQIAPHPIVEARRYAYAESARRREAQERSEGRSLTESATSAATAVVQSISEFISPTDDDPGVYLPEDDPQPDLRAAGLEVAQASYNYRYNYPPGVAMADLRASDEPNLVESLVESVAQSLDENFSIGWKDEYYSPSYIARSLSLNKTIKDNVHACKRDNLSEHAHLIDDALKGNTPLDEAFQRRGLSGFADHYLNDSYALADGLGDIRIAPEDYIHLYATIERSPVVNYCGRSAMHHDMAFAWQRLAGVNPMVLRRVEALTDNFPVTEALFQSVLPGDSLEVAGKEGRLFLADYSVLDGMPNGTISLKQLNAQIEENDFGPTHLPGSGEAQSRLYQKYIYAPLALFALPRPWSGVYGNLGTHLVPVAIQCGQRPGPQVPIWTPHDGWRWKMACMTVQVADGNHHQASTHLARTHLAMEAFVLSAKRHLSERHPIRVLLTPHFRFTLAINHTAAFNLVAPGGEVDQVLGSTLEGSLSLSAKSLRSFNLDDWLPRNDITRRGLDDPELLPVYPYRDDGLLLWDVIRDWVEEYVELYYHSDQDVFGDVEIQTFVGEVGKTEDVDPEVGGRLPGVGAVETVERLVDLITFLIFTASVQHAAVNFPQFSYMGYLPNMQGAGFAPAPTPETPDTREAWAEMLAPLGLTLLQFNVVYQLSSIRMGLLGDYREDGLSAEGRDRPSCFRDKRVDPLVHRFRQRLAELEERVLHRERTRLLPYPWLRPSLITESIHI